MKHLSIIPVVALLLTLVSAPLAVCSEPDAIGRSVAETLLAGGEAVSADFDGDRRTDATLVVADSGRGISVPGRYTITVQLSTKNNSKTFTLQAQPGGLDLSARDVDGDRDLDLVITGRFTGEHIGVWVNDGAGELSPGTSEYPAWIWGDGPRLICGVIQKPAGAIPSPVSSFVVCSSDCVAAALPTISVSHQSAKLYRNPTPANCRIRPPPQIL